MIFNVPNHPRSLANALYSVHGISKVLPANRSHSQALPDTRRHGQAGCLPYIISVMRTFMRRGNPETALDCFATLAMTGGCDGLTAEAASTEIHPMQLIVVNIKKTSQ
jgi:hypothetical protein